MRGETSEACRLFREALRLDPKETNVRAALGSLLLRLDRWDEARVELKRVVQEVPEQIVAHYNLGLVYGRLNRPEEAHHQFELASN